MKKILSFIACIVLALQGHAQSYSWKKKADIPTTPVYDPFGFSIGSKGYTGSGRASGNIYKIDFWEIDPATNTWTQKANFAGAGRYGARGFSINNTGYVVSGYASSGFKNDLWAYNPASNAWSQKAPHPGTARYTGVAFSVNGLGYFGGGSVFGNNYQVDFYEYNPNTAAWTAKANFPGTPRQSASVFVINNDAYVGMGSNAVYNSNYSTWYKFNPGANSWTQVASLPGSARNAAFSFCINGEGHLTQGYDNVLSSTTIFKDHWKYNPTTNQWTQLPNFPGTQTFEGVYFSIGNNGYIGRGCDVLNFSHFMNELWEYSPDVTGVEEIPRSLQATVYPNPAQDEFTISLQDDPTASNLFLSVTDPTGKLVHQGRITGKNVHIGASHWRAGTYVIRISRSDGSTAAVHQLVKS